MLMVDHEMKTTAPDTGLRIRTEVKAPVVAHTRFWYAPCPSCTR